MPQARLPDINSAFVKYRTEVLVSLKSKNYDSAFGALYALNALLPEEYRVKISTALYSKATKQEAYAICTGCKKKTDYNEIQIIKIILPLIDSILSDSEFENVWYCPKCNHENKLQQTTIKQIIPSEPSFHHIVPKPPERTDGLMARSGYNKKISNWIRMFLVELEERMGQFREDNWRKGGEQDEIEVDTSGENDDSVQNKQNIDSEETGESDQNEEIEQSIKEV